MIIANEEKEVLTCGVERTNAFRIETSPKAFEILSSNIYTHKVRAVIREISCNAHDAHVAANSNKNFDVHLPTSLESWFSVRDYGTGLDEEGVMSLYTTYFYSNKDKSNDFIGGMGIGSKAFYCITDTATVTSYYYGTKTVYTCYKNESGQPCIAKLTSVPTNEPNGLEVTISVEDKSQREEFCEEAVNVFQYFDVVPNINIKSVVDDIEKNKNKYILQAEGFSISHGSALKAVMGNVAYNIPQEFNTNYIGGVIKFNIGELNFDPGRENLSLDERTKNNLKAKIDMVKSLLAQVIYDKINEEPTPFRKAIRARSLLGHSMKNFIRNSDLYDDISALARIPVLGNITTFYRHGRSVSKSLTQNFPTGDDIEYYLDKPRFEKRIREYIKNTSKQVVILSQDQIDHAKIDQDFIKNLDSLPKPQKTYNKSTTKLSSYKVINFSTKNYGWGPQEDARIVSSKESITPETHFYLVVSRNTISSKLFGSYMQMKRFLTIVKSNISTVLIKQSEENKFKKNGYKSIDDYVSTTNFGKIYTYTEGLDEFSSVYEKTEGKDYKINPYLEKLLELKSLANETGDNFENISNLEVDSTTINDLAKEILEKFPILQVVNSYQIEKKWDIISKYIEN
jgi:hypothetical protein